MEQHGSKKSVLYLHHCLHRLQTEHTRAFFSWFYETETHVPVLAYTSLMLRLQMRVHYRCTHTTTPGKPPFSHLKMTDESAQHTVGAQLAAAESTEGAVA